MRMRKYNDRVEPTMEEDIAQAVQNLKPVPVHEYAPPAHPDRINASAEIMCDGVDKLFSGASEDNQKIVDQCEAALNDMKHFKTLVDEGMREAASGLKKHIRHVMALLEDGTAKMQHNPFSNGGDKDAVVSGDNLRAESQ